uniref:RNA helicase n=1 Tax=Timema monikensis TaxID=170555 RepID=A0A7R9EFP6_9NEOP|nr:unnamed protein product [Timema monikensis]
MARNRLADRRINMDYLLHQAYVSFRRYCLEADALPVDLHVVISDILQGAGHIDDIFPYFLRHSKHIFPHLECMDDLKKISDLRTPANWYPGARGMTRKIIFHAGPTNSGKTFHAMERFLSAKSGVYCGPLKLLATEVFNKSNDRGTPCDLVTGEERKYATNEDNISNHVSCTVEMTSINVPYEVAIIDEIQMMRDTGRGWAWTRALLGVMAEEIHVCGEDGAVDLVHSLMSTTGEHVEVRKYHRLTELKVESKALGSLDAVQPGDCIVCFSKNDIYNVARVIETRGMEVAVIYGGLPPGTKLAQAHKFNDVDNPCKIMVATDAIGMGLNLSIRRVVFYSLIKPTVNEKGEKEMDTISVSQALQIAGRAGRYGTQFDTGYVTTFKPEDLSTLQSLLSQQPEPIIKAGLHPTAEQIELYAYHLPNSTLSNLMDIFVTLSTVDDSLYFMCNIEDFKFLADMIQHVPLPLRARYVFCCAPINKKMPFVCTMFLKLANALVVLSPTAEDGEIEVRISVGYRFMDLFPEANLVRDMQKELDAIIQQGVFQLTRLLRNSETAVSSGTMSVDDDEFALHQQKQSYFRDNKLVERSPIGRGKLTERLLAQGLLTPNMLHELRQEWKMGNSDDPGGDATPKKPRRNRKVK